MYFEIRAEKAEAGLDQMLYNNRGKCNQTKTMSKEDILEWRSNDVNFCFYWMHRPGTNGGKGATS